MQFAQAGLAIFEQGQHPGHGPPFTVDQTARRGKGRDGPAAYPKRKQAAILRTRIPWQATSIGPQKHAIALPIDSQAQMVAAGGEQAGKDLAVPGKKPPHLGEKRLGVGLVDKAAHGQTIGLDNADALHLGHGEANFLLARGQRAAGRTGGGAPGADRRVRRRSIGQRSGLNRHGDLPGRRLTGTTSPAARLPERP